MNIDLSKVKALYKKIPNSLLLPLWEIPFSVFCGSNYRSTIKVLEEFKLCSDTEKKKRSDDVLINYLNESILYVPFYKDFARNRLKINEVTSAEQLFDFPIISKELFQEEPSLFFDQRYLKKSYNVSTGGTTGAQTHLLMSNDCYAVEWAFINSFLSENGIDVNSRRLCLRGVAGEEKNTLIGTNPIYKEMLISPFNMNPKNVIESIDTINKFSPKWIHGYPSSVAAFSKILNDHKFKISTISDILLVSEKVYSEQLNDLKTAFDANIHTFYGMTERVVFAPYINNSFIPHPLYCRAEEYNGELIGTGFVNQATRLIRYRTGDQVRVKNEGNIVTEILEVEGRWGKEFLLGKTGVRITMTALNTHSPLLKNVQKYQFYQESQGLCNLLILPSATLSEKEIFEIVNIFQQKVGNELQIAPKIVKSIALTKRGKHRFINSIFS